MCVCVCVCVCIVLKNSKSCECFVRFALRKLVLFMEQIFSRYLFTNYTAFYFFNILPLYNYKKGVEYLVVFFLALSDRVIPTGITNFLTPRFL